MPRRLVESSHGLHGSQRDLHLMTFLVFGIVKVSLKPTFQQILKICFAKLYQNVECILVHGQNLVSKSIDCNFLRESDERRGFLTQEFHRLLIRSHLAACSSYSSLAIRSRIFWTQHLLPALSSFPDPMSFSLDFFPQLFTTELMVLRAAAASFLVFPLCNRVALSFVLLRTATMMKR